MSEMVWRMGVGLVASSPFLFAGVSTLQDMLRGERGRNDVVALVMGFGIPAWVLLLLAVAGL